MDRTMQPSRSTVIAYWTFTALFALQMGFTAYAQLCLPQVARVFSHLGFPDYFRIELCVAKLVGLAVLLVPMVPAVVKEWAYAGFAIVLGSALIAHLAVGDGVAAWSWAVGTFVLEALSYYFYRRQTHAGEAVSFTRQPALHAPSSI
jgi:DoxX-like family